MSSVENEVPDVNRIVILKGGDDVDKVARGLNEDGYHIVSLTAVHAAPQYVPPNVG